MTTEEDYSDEITSHLMNPKNYGVLEDADGIGVGVDNATKAYVIIYIKHDDETINEINYAASGSQDAIVLGSMLTEMLKGDKISNALTAVANLEKDLQSAYAAVEAPEIDTTKPEGEQVKQISTEHQDASNMVLTAFRAAMRHIERKKEGIEEEQFEMSIAKQCPYSNTDCHFVTKEGE
ncbi:MAG: iron-sulfur cluster assembly scaffold protein [Campylobacterota bacterium]|nr:iron-sulfur cluster assembly scaffold protein [Campylobacterota bacterium]